MRPLAAGYVVVPAGLDGVDAEARMRGWRSALERLAGREGFALGAVFTDTAGRESGLFELMGYLCRAGAAAVVVPQLGHLTQAGCLRGADRLTVARYLRVPVLEVNPGTGAAEFVGF